jgi:hypothetical protein
MPVELEIWAQTLHGLPMEIDQRCEAGCPQRDKSGFKRGRRGNGLVQTALCRYPTGMWTRLLWLHGFTGVEIMLAHCSRSAQGAGPFHYDRFKVSPRNLALSGLGAAGVSGASVAAGAGRFWPVRRPGQQPRWSPSTWPCLPTMSSASSPRQTPMSSACSTGRLLSLTITSARNAMAVPIIIADHRCAGCHR